ncbi:MAG: Hsp70 family protein, partial [Synergistaceae bacterium]|jgi:molecular chaperone DnaK|nr:Hsp70 family protein [Synergistaceae bacterium]
VKDVVITVPAYFGDAQRMATQQAGKIAGLNVLKTVNEPTAAALAYGANVDKDETILVYDLGGGTFDVTIMKIENKDIKVVATGGDRNLGGFNWDNEIMNYLYDTILSEYKVDFNEKEHGMNTLRKLAETAKIALSDRQSTVVNVDLGEAGRKKIDLSREKFNELTESLNNRTIDMAGFTLEDAGLEWKDIDKILLVGGSTRMPIIRELVEKASGKKPSTELHPDEVVAMGAAIQAAITMSQDGGGIPQSIKGMLPPPPKDVCSHSLGIVAVRGEDIDALYNAVVMPRNTEIPGKASEQFATVADNQLSLHVEVNEGEGEDLNYVTKIGEGVLKLDPYPKGSPLEVVFEYDENQIVHVNVYDKKKKHLGEIKIQRKANMNDEQVAQMTALVKKTQVS